MIEKYKTRTGVMQYRPVLSAKQAERMAFDANGAGFCLACGAEASGCEPDARQYACEGCGAHKVYGIDDVDGTCEDPMTSVKAILEANGLSAAIPVVENGAPGWEENKIRDVVFSISQYGSATERQIGFIKTLLGRIEARAAAGPKVPVPTGRQVVSGEILKVEVKFSPSFGAVTKMLVKAVEGYLIWVTMPSLWKGGYGKPKAEKGSKVKFSAEVKPSPNDPFFGFGSRPTPLSLEVAI